MTDTTVPQVFLLPSRAGERPQTTDHAPHSQINQLAPIKLRADLSRKMVELISLLPGVSTGFSRRAPQGSVGFYLDPELACKKDRCFLLGNEFAHVHSRDDGGLHAILAEPLRTEAMEKGWAEPHPFAGQPTVSEDTVMIYAPRDDAELETIVGLVRKSWQNANLAD